MRCQYVLSSGHPCQNLAVVAVVVCSRCPARKSTSLLCGTHRGLKAGPDSIPWHSDADAIGLVRDLCVDTDDAPLLQSACTLKCADSALEQEIPDVF